MKAMVIGLGPHGRRVASVLTAMPDIELAAVVDSRQDVLAAAEIPATTAHYGSLSELSAPRDIELVCVATNGPSHAELSIAAIEAGARYIFLEKPMACSLAECDRILDAARRAGARVAVDHVRRHSPAYRWLRERIASGDWGQPRAVWMQRPGIGLGCNATHSFDAICFVTNRGVRHVTGWVDEPVNANPRGTQFVDPGGLVVMELDGGVRGVVAQIEDGAGPTSVEVDLTGARVRLDERSGAIEVIERDLSIRPGPNRPAVFRDGCAPQGLSAKIDMLAAIRAGIEELISTRPMISDAVHGRAAIEVLIATYLSHRRGGGPVKLPLTSPADLEIWLPVT